MSAAAAAGMFSRRLRSQPETTTTDVHVLAVDDSLVDRKVIERLLKITSCKVTAVESGWRACQYLGLDQEETTSPDFVNGLKVDLIITDYCMPGMTGYELLKKIKGSANFREVPVVIMSSENVVARIDRCLEEGAEDFIVKPVKLSDVKRLKDYMFGETRGTIPSADKNNKEEKGSFNKRKLQEMSDNSPPLSLSSSPSTSTSPSPPASSPSTSPSPPNLSPSTSPSKASPSNSPSPPTESPTTSSSPQSPTSSESPSSTPPTSPPFSPSQLESPTMRLKVTNYDQA